MRSLLILILVVIFYYFIKSFFTSRKERVKPGNGRKVLREVDDMVKDPSCETYIPKSTALEKVYKGKRFYFCSEECVEKFKKQNSV